MDLFKGTSFAIIVFICLLAVGTFAYSIIEGWGYLDALYFSVVTVTTVGYGDFAPQTDTGKIFMIFFSFIGIAMAFYFFSIIGKNVFKKMFDTKLREHHDKIIEHIEETQRKETVTKKKSK